MTHKQALEKFNSPSFIFIVLYLYYRIEILLLYILLLPFGKGMLWVLQQLEASSKWQTKTVFEISMYQFPFFKLMNKFVVFTDSHYYWATAKTLSITFTFKLL